MVKATGTLPSSPVGMATVCSPGQRWQPWHLLFTLSPSALLSASFPPSLKTRLFVHLFPPWLASALLLLRFARFGSSSAFSPEWGPAWLPGCVVFHTGAGFSFFLTAQRLGCFWLLPLEGGRGLRSRCACLLYSVLCFLQFLVHGRQRASRLTLTWQRCPAEVRCKRFTCGSV